MLFRSRELVHTPEKSGEILGTAFWLKAAAICPMWIVLIILSILIEHDDTTDLMIAIVAFSMLFNITSIIDLYFQAKVQSRYSVYGRLIQLLVSSIIKITLVYLEAELIWFAWAVLLDAVVLAVSYIFIYVYSKSSIRFFKKWNTELAKKFINDCWPIVLSALAVAIYMNIDQVMIKNLLDAESVGIYAAASKISISFYFLSTVICSSLFPAILNAKNKSDELYQHRVQSLYDLMLWMGVIIALPMTFLSDWLIAILFGVSFGGAGSGLVIVVWSGVFVFLQHASWRWFIAENKQNIACFRLIVGAVINVALNWWMIPVWGVEGAAIATLISYAVAIYFGNLLLSETRVVFRMMSSSLLLHKTIVPIVKMIKERV